ncbi:MAG: hypothetical protein BJ554DRAFT_7577 [Olpidium bornovanus]|uniref:Uncharacterized protein n=1 Tax=Olpidium bornovanus TaxID=278681 RepID=A0A8H7ZW90_9FUNG|nr:MAG: hypothetical protein BJ554DRAFT_7577 [Olpidium bornovanus]
MGHRRIVTTFAAAHQQSLPPGAHRQWLPVDDDLPFSGDEAVYEDGAQANKLPNGGRWWWTNWDVGQFRPGAVQ